MVKVKFFLSIFKESFSEFMDDNGLKLSAALSYYTVFSLAPMLLVIISMVSIFFGREAFQGELFGQISGLVGKEASLQLQEIIKNAAISNKSFTAATVGVVTLLIGATGVFAEIQDSINYIWSIKSKPKKGWLQYLKNRLLSFSVIITLGFLLLVSLGVNALVDLLSGRLERYFSEVSVIIFSVLNVALVVVIITALFTVIFKILPDGHLRWKECIVGAAFTALLFLVGKFGITFYLGQSDLGATYGTSASIVILLTWVYYSSIILYFGAEFTKVYARSDGRGIEPNEHAVLVIRKEAEHADVASSIDLAKKPVAKVAKVKNQLFDKVGDFVDSKLAIIRAEIEGMISKMITPAVYYAVLVIIGFGIVISLTLITGHFLNVWLDSYFLGYVILLGLCILLIGIALKYRKKITESIRLSLLPKEKTV